jgi:hypothetical protein
MAAGLADSSSAAATSLARHPSQPLTRTKSNKSHSHSLATFETSDAYSGVSPNLNRTPSNPALSRQKSTNTMLPSLTDPSPALQNPRSRRSSNPLQPPPSNPSPPLLQESYASHYAPDSQHPAATSTQSSSRPNSQVLDATAAKRSSQLNSDFGDPYDGYATSAPVSQEQAQLSSYSPETNNRNSGFELPTPTYFDENPSRYSVQDDEDYGFSGGKRVLRVSPVLRSDARYIPINVLDRLLMND